MLQLEIEVGWGDIHIAQSFCDKAFLLEKLEIHHAAALHTTKALVRHLLSSLVSSRLVSGWKAPIGRHWILNGMNPIKVKIVVVNDGAEAWPEVRRNSQLIMKHGHA